MDMVFIGMGVHDDLMPFRHLLCQLPPDLVRLFRRHGVFLIERLDDVVRLYPAVLPPEFPSRLHLRTGVVGHAINPRTCRRPLLRIGEQLVRRLGAP